MSMNAASRRKTLLARHRYSLAAACALALAALAALRAAPAAVAETPQAAPALRVTTVVAGPGTVPIRIAVSGSLVGRDEIAIRTPLQDQRIAAVLVEEGDCAPASRWPRWKRIPWTRSCARRRRRWAGRGRRCSSRKR